MKGLFGGVMRATTHCISWPLIDTPQPPCSTICGSGVEQ